MPPLPKSRRDTKSLEDFSVFHEECMFFLTFVDFDECLSPDACGAGHVCNNTIGSYRCECQIGFVADSDAQDPLNPVCIGKKMDNQKMAVKRAQFEILHQDSCPHSKKVTKWNL